MCTPKMGDACGTLPLESVTNIVKSGKILSSEFSPHLITSLAFKFIYLVDMKTQLPCLLLVGLNLATVRLTTVPVSRLPL
jgi:hypothetical protein